MRPTALALTLALCVSAEETPEAPGVTVEISAERTEFALGDPILLNVVYRNEGKAKWLVMVPLMCGFSDDFEARDALGAKVPNPFADLEYGGYDGAVETHELPPGGTVKVRKYVNESVAFEKPGEYDVTANVEVWGGPNDRVITMTPRCKSKPLKIKILPAPDKKTRDAIVADLKALSRDVWAKLLERTEYARYRPYVTEMNCETNALRLLAFRREQELLPFWIERLGDYDASAYAAEALAGLPDRAAVLKALEERLAKGEREHFLWLYTCLAVPRTEGAKQEDVAKRRSEIEKRYAEK